MKNNKITTILFDLDGTLIATERLFFEAIRDTLKTEYNQLFSLQDYRKDFLTTDGGFAEYASQKDIELKNEDELWEKIRETYDSRLNEALADRSILHSFETVKLLIGADYRVALVTSNEKSRALAILSAYGANLLFEEIITRDDVTHKKPNPECYLLAIKKMKVSAESCLAVEDTAKGFEAAKNAGVKCLLVLEHTQTDKDDLLAMGADIFDTVDQACGFLLAQ